MDDRIEQLERLAALHREGALSDDEFRAEKLRVLAGERGTGPQPEVVPLPPLPPPPAAGATPGSDPEQAVPTPPPVSPAADLRPPVAPPVVEVGSDPDFGDRFVEPPAPRRTGLWIGLAVAAVVLVMAGAVWFMRSTPAADSQRSTIGSAAPRASSPDDAALGGMPGEAINGAALDDEPGNTVDPVEEPDADAAAGGSDVSAALALSDPADCRFAAGGTRAFDSLLSRSDGGWNTDGPVQLGAVTLTPKLEVSQVNPLRPADEEPVDDEAAAPQRAAATRYYSTARAPDGVSWNGLRLSRLVRSHLARPGGGTVDRRGLTFREEPAALRARLSGLGVDVPAGGRPLGGSCRGEMRVESIPGGSALVCERRCG